MRRDQQRRDEALVAEADAASDKQALDDKNVLLSEALHDAEDSESKIEELTRLRRNVQRERRIYKAAAAIGCIAGMIGIVVGVVSINRSNTVNDQFTSYLKDVDVRRVEACERDNVQLAGFRLLALTSSTGWSAFAAILLPEGPQDQGDIDNLKLFQNNVVGPFNAMSDPDDPNNPFKPRDCRPEAL